MKAEHRHLSEESMKIDQTLQGGRVAGATSKSKPMGGGRTCPSCCLNNKQINNASNIQLSQRANVTTHSLLMVTTIVCSQANNVTPTYKHCGFPTSLSSLGNRSRTALSNNHKDTTRETTLAKTAHGPTQTQKLKSGHLKYGTNR